MIAISQSPSPRDVGEVVRRDRLELGSGLSLAAGLEQQGRERGVPGDDPRRAADHLPGRLLEFADPPLLPPQREQLHRVVLGGRDQVSS